VRSRDSYRQNGQQAEISFEAENLPAVWADPHYLSDAFASIIQNALEAAGPNGQVSVEARGEDRRGTPGIVIDIFDNGPGMTRDFVRNRLFHPFQTLKQNGIGLGLYTAREIIRSHGGRIQVKSRVGEGTLVSVLLPAARGDSAS
jgi:signal transduction histidine kinase